MKNANKTVKELAVVGIGILIFWLALLAAFGTNNPFYVVSSGSMVPALNVYDILVVQAKVPFETIQIGDIIVFNRPSGDDRVIVHRVVSVIDDDPYTIRTKGDANSGSIPGTDFPITDEEYIGKVEHVVPQLGFVTRIFAPPVNYVIIAVILGILAFRHFRSKKPDMEPPSVDKISQDRAYSDDERGNTPVQSDADAKRDAGKLDD